MQQSAFGHQRLAGEKKTWWTGSDGGAWEDGGRRAPSVLKYQRATHTSQCPHPLSWRLLEIGFDVRIIRSHYEACNLAGSWRLRKNLPFSLPVEASMKIAAFSYFETTRRPKDAPRESCSIYDFRGTRPEQDATYAFGHAYNHLHRYPSLLRSIFRKRRYRRTPRTLHPVELTVYELCRDVRHANVGARSLYYVLRVRGTVARWAA